MNRAPGDDASAPEATPSEPTPAPVSLQQAAPGSDLEAWLRRPVGRVVAAAAIAAVLLGGGVLMGHVATPQGPATLTAAITKAAAGELPCGNTATLPGALKTVCGVPTSQPIVTPRLKRPGTAGLAALRSLFGPTAVVGRIRSVTPTQIALGGAKMPLLLGITASTECLRVEVSSGALTTTGVPASALHPGLLVIVVPGASAAAGAGRAAVYVYLLPSSALGAPA